MVPRYNPDQAAKIGLVRAANPRQSSFVDLPPVTDSRHFHQQSCVVDGVDHADAPLLITAPELLAAGWTWIGGKIFQARNDALDQLAGQLLSSFSALDVNGPASLDIELSARDQDGL